MSESEKEIDPFEEALNAINQGGDDPTLAEAAGEDSGAPNDADEMANAMSIPDASPPAPAVGEGAIDLDFLLDIKLKVTFEVGRSKMLISDLLTLGQGSVIELNRLVGENLNILVNGHLLATGEVVVVNEHFGARISEIITPEERVKRMGV